MFSKQDLIGAISTMMEDVENCAWDPSSDCMHPEIVPLLNQLPDDGEKRGYETKDIRKGDYVVYGPAGFNPYRAESDAFELRPNLWGVVISSSALRPHIATDVVRIDVPPEVAALLDPQHGPARHA